MLTSGLVLIVTLVAFESLAISTVMPLVEDDLGDLWLYGWVFSAFFLGNLIGIVVAGTAADRMRPAIPFAAGLVVFAIGLVVGGLAPTMLVLVLGRALQGLGAGAMPAISYVCIGRGYPHEQRPTMFALISSAWVDPLGRRPRSGRGHRLGGRLALGVPRPAAALWGDRAAGPRRRGPDPGSRRALGGVEPAQRRHGGGRRRASCSPGWGPVLCSPGSLSWWSAWPSAPAVRRLVPPGTLVARRGLPATVLIRGVLTFAFFAGDAYVSYALITVRGLSAAVAGIALTAATLTWTAASWLQARWLDRFGAARFVAAGFAGVALGSLAMLLVLVPSVPAAVGISCWSIAGFGIGLAYAPLSVVTLHEAPEGQEGRATSSLQLSDMLGTALGSGVGGVLVAVGTAATDSDTPGLVAVYLLGAAVAVGGMVLARRVPGRVGPAAPC